MECAENPHQSDSDGRNRSWFGDHEPCPGIEKSCKRSIAVTDVNIFSPRLRFKRPKLSVGERSKYRENAADNPCQVNQLGRSNRLHHLFRDKKDATADNSPHDNRDRMPQAELA